METVVGHALSPDRAGEIRPERAGGQSCRPTNRHDTGQPFEPVKQRGIVRARLLPTAIGLGVEEDRRHQNAARVEPRIHGAERDEATHQQTRATQQHQRQRHLPDDQPVAHSMLWRGGRRAKGGRVETLRRFRARAAPSAPRSASGPRG